MADLIPGTGEFAGDLANQTAGIIDGLRIPRWRGTDLYSRFTGLSIEDRSHLADVRSLVQRVTHQLREEAPEVTILGPLPRFGGEVSTKTWKATAAYHLEKSLLKEQFGDREGYFGETGPGPHSEDLPCTASLVFSALTVAPSGGAGRPDVLPATVVSVSDRLPNCSADRDLNCDLVTVRTVVT